jgi:hypothetical protein
MHNSHQSLQVLHQATWWSTHRVLEVVWAPHLAHQLSKAQHERRLALAHIVGQKEITERRDVRQRLYDNVDVVRVLQVIQTDEACSQLHLVRELMQQDP